MRYKILFKKNYTLITEKPTRTNSIICSILCGWVLAGCNKQGNLLGMDKRQSSSSQFASFSDNAKSEAAEELEVLNTLYNTHKNNAYKNQIGILSPAIWDKVAGKLNGHVESIKSYVQGTYDLVPLTDNDFLIKLIPSQDDLVKNISSFYEQIKECYDSVKNRDGNRIDVKKYVEELCKSFRNNIPLAMHSKENLQNLLNSNKTLLSALDNEHIILKDKFQRTIQYLELIDNMLDLFVKKIEIQSHRDGFHSIYITGVVPYFFKNLPFAESQLHL